MFVRHGGGLGSWQDEVRANDLNCIGVLQEEFVQACESNVYEVKWKISVRITAEINKK